jgi:DNA modification methylase
MAYIIQEIPVDDLSVYVNNSRTHSTDQVKQISNSIKEFGFTNPLLIDKNKEIIAGHGRLMAAKQLGLSKVPCIELSNLSEKQKKAYVIADNQLALNAGWNESILSMEIGDLSDNNFDISLLGFNDLDLNGYLLKEFEGLTDEDEVPEPPVDPVTKLGDIWQLGNHRLLCGDSTIQSNIDKLINNNKIDLVFTDPPYGMFLNTDYSSQKTSLSFLQDKDVFGGKKYDKVIGDNEDFKPQFIKIIFDNFNYCKEIFLWGADYYSEYLINKNDGSWVVWDKRLDEKADKMYGSTFELCWSKKKHKRMLARVKWAGIFGTEKEFDKKRHHPTQKPVALVQWFFDYFGFEKLTNVFDCYLGAGTTLIACEKLNRICYGMELDPKYCDVIIKRWENFTGKKARLIKDNHATT